MTRASSGPADELGGLVGTSPLEWPEDEVAAARRTAGRLASTARELVDRGLVAGTCPADTPCALAPPPGRRCICRLARGLAATEQSAEVTRSALRSLDDADVRRRFLDALRRAGSAVYVCRRTLHGSGGCLFVDGEPHDLCGEVLAAAHELSASVAHAPTGR